MIEPRTIGTDIICAGIKGPIFKIEHINPNSIIFIHLIENIFGHQQNFRVMQIPEG